MDVVYLTADDVLEYHAEALSIGGGLDGLRSVSALDAAVHQAQQTFHGNDLYPSIADKAACYGYFIAEAQAFLEGNKRTAVITMLAFLELNDHPFAASDDEIEQVFVGLGEKTVTRDEFFDWVRIHAKQ